MPHISQTIIRSIAYTLVISGSFYLGIIIYPNFSANQTEIAVTSIKTFAPYMEQATKKDFVILAGNSKLILKSDQIKKWLEPYVREYTGNQDIRPSTALISTYIKTLASDLNTEPIDAKLVFKNNKAQVFVPSANGRILNAGASLATISSALFEGKSSASLIFDDVAPDITLDKINDLGIETLLGRGESDYGKSSSARIHNIKVGMTKFNGIILKPGEEFSFNNLLGEVDAGSNFQAELVIKNGQLVKEFGGGLCQVATTVFRGAIMAGLEIKERKPHSFPVQYYNPQGFDATIYPGVVDLRFINNTDSHILIQTKLSGSKLSVEVYGKDTDREVQIEGPFQYAKQSSGAMKAYFVRKITKDGVVEKDERFDSVYKAPPPHPLERNPLE